MLQAFPLDDEYRCPVCLDDLSPALVYTGCNHRICAECVSSCGTKCPLCRQTSPPRPDHQFSGIVEKQMKYIRRFRCTRCGANEIPADAAAKNMHVCGSRVDHVAAKYKNLCGESGISDRALRMIVCDAMGVENYYNLPQSVNVNRYQESRVIDGILEEAARLAELKRLAKAGGPSSAAAKNLILATQGTHPSTNGKGVASAGGARSTAATMASALMNAPALGSASLLSSSPSLDGASDKSSSVFVDFDYLSSSLYLADPSYNHVRGKIENMSTIYNAKIITVILNNIAKKMVENGLAASVASVRIVIMGVPYGFRDQAVLDALKNKVSSSVEIRVSNAVRKKTDVDEQLDRDFTDSRNDAAVVLVSGDPDFLSCTTKLIREGKIVVTVHNAARSSINEKQIGVWAANNIWKVTELLMLSSASASSAAANDAAALLVQQHTKDRSFARDSEEATRAFHENVELVNKLKAFGHGKPVSANWLQESNIAKQGNEPYKYIALKDVVGHADSKVYVHETRMRGPFSIFSSSANSQNYFVISAPNARPLNPNLGKIQEKEGANTPKSADFELVAIAAFPDTWEVIISGNSTPLKNLEPTAGLETLLLSAATGSTNNKLEWCRAGESCKRGISCVNAHKRGTPCIVQPAASPAKPAFSYAAMASLPGEKGADTNNAPATIIAASAKQIASAAAASSGTPGSLNNQTTPGALTASTSGSGTHIVELVNVAGEKMPVTELEPTGVFQFYKKHPQGIGKICVNYPDCDRGLQCMFVHLKKLTFEEGYGAEGSTSGSASANQASTPVVSSTTMFPTIPGGDAVTPSRKQRKQQQMQQEENVVPVSSGKDGDLSSNTPSVAVVKSTSIQSKLGNPTTIAAAAALAAVAANPLGESIHNLPYEVNVEGLLIPLNKLEKNGIVEFAKRHPAQPAKWCLHYPNCKGGVRCGFAHVSKNYDKDDLIEAAKPGYEIEAVQSVKEAVSAVAHQDAGISATTTTKATRAEPARKQESTTSFASEKSATTKETPIKKKAAAAAAAEQQQQEQEQQQKAATTKKNSAKQQQQQSETASLPSLSDDFLTSTITAPAAVRSYKDSANAAKSTAGGLTSPTASAAPMMGSMAAAVAKNKDKPMEPVREPIRIRATTPPRVISQPAPPGAKPIPVKMVNVDGTLYPITDLEKTAVFDFVKNHPDGVAKRCVHDPGCKHGERCTFVHLKLSAIEADQMSRDGSTNFSPSSAAAKWQDDDPKEFNIENVIVPRAKIERTAFVDYLAAHPGVIGKWCLKHPECRKGAECSYVHRKV